MEIGDGFFERTRAEADGEALARLANLRRREAVSVPCRGLVVEVERAGRLLFQGSDGGRLAPPVPEERGGQEDVDEAMHQRRGAVGLIGARLHGPSRLVQTRR